MMSFKWTPNYALLQSKIWCLVYKVRTMPDNKVSLDVS